MDAFKKISGRLARGGGADAPVSCPSCGKPNPPDYRFCEHCGWDLSADPALELEESASPACGTFNPADFLFCQRCGARMDAPPPPSAKVRCVNCGAMNTEEDRFCQACGQLVNEVAPPPKPPKPPEPGPAPGLVPCKNCGIMNPPENVTCVSCGKLVRVYISGGLNPGEADVLSRGETDNPHLHPLDL